MPITGPRFMWSSMQQNPLLSKLDMFFLSLEWESMYSFAKGESISRPTSDHFPILLNGKMQSLEPRPFKFENMWLKYPDFVDLVKGWWDQLQASRKPGQQLRIKLKKLREILRT